MYIDTHVHLNSDALFQEADHYIKKALAKGVSTLIVIGFDHETNKRAIKLAHQYDNIYASVGYHPTEANHIKEEDFKILENYLQDEKVVAVGECGLDLYWDKTHVKEQVEVFTKQIKLSKKYDKPLSIHMRDASELLYETIKKEAPLKGIMHCYSGSTEMASKFLDLGLHISLGGPVTFKNAKTPKEVAKAVPIERLLIETDAPYLAPHPYRGKQNDSSLLPLIAESIAKIREESIEYIATNTSNNAKKLFNI
ncbi:MAG: TatD family hydrolase [Candidatus Izemoplasmataceae bacterium]